MKYLRENATFLAKTPIFYKSGEWALQTQALHYHYNEETNTGHWRGPGVSTKEQLFVPFYDGLHKIHSLSRSYRTGPDPADWKNDEWVDNDEFVRPDGIERK